MYFIIYIPIKDVTKHPPSSDSESISEAGHYVTIIPSFDTRTLWMRRAETVTPVTARATRRFYSCPKIQTGKKLSIIEQG
jgi:hypothetical protein